MATADDELTTDIIIEGDPEEIDRFRKEYLCVGMVAQLPDDKAHKHGSTSRMGGDHSSALGTDMLSIVLQQLCGHRAQFDGEGHGSREGLAGVISLQECTELNHAAPDEHCFYVSKNMCTQGGCGIDKKITRFTALRSGSSACLGGRCFTQETVQTWSMVKHAKH
eukprot:scaffold11880_cov19-Tisochrysis_lutea.AAC.1